MNKPKAVEAPSAPIAQMSDPLELLAEMGRDFAASRDIERALKRGLVRIVEFLDAEAGSIFLLDEAGETLRCDACVGPVDITGITVSIDQGIVGRCVRTNRGEIVRDVSEDPGFNRTVDERTGFTTHSILSAPMSVKEERIGAIQLLNKRSGDGRFAPSDLTLLQTLGTSAGLALLNARMATALVEQERLRRELELAAEIQQSLLPAPREEEFPIHGVNRAARAISGDFYDFFPLDDGRICFSLGDVAGKGITAALLMSKTVGLYRYLGKTRARPGKLLEILNSEICETATRGMFITMVGGIFDPRDGSVVLANAGHEPPLLVSSDGLFTSWPAEAPPLGIAPDVLAGGSYPEVEMRLDGGTLYVFTDGLTEARTAPRGQLTVEGVRELIVRNRSLAVRRRLAAMLDHVAHDGVELHDDVTILAIDDSIGSAARTTGDGGGGR